MRLKFFACFLMLIIGQIFAFPVNAISSTGVIRTAQPYTLTSQNGVLTRTASHELIEIENISDQPLNMTGWSIKYQGATSSTSQTLRLIAPSAGAQYTFLPAHARDTFMSKDYASSHAGSSNLIFNLSLADNAGNVMLLDNAGNEIDRLGWATGSASNAKAEGGRPVMLNSTTFVMQRQNGDTDNNEHDFIVLPVSTDPGYMFGGLYDTVDACNNIDGFQDAAPIGMIAYDDGTCMSADRCSNMEGDQADVPAGYDRTEGGDCLPHDACPNLEEQQDEVPDGYELTGGVCQKIFVPLELRLSELLANPNGADEGNEFIELYNASNDTANLADYALSMSGKQYHFPFGKLLLPRTYISFSDDDMNMTFPNTTGQILQLIAKNGNVIDSMPSYQSAPIDETWAVIDGVWQFTNTATRGLENSRSVVTNEEQKADEVQYSECAANQYRSPDTHRCRSVATAASSLTPCRDGQYRSEETNRCRSIVQTVSAALKPCQDDQFRNPATGRCKQIASTEDVLPACNEGWERNLETNRCRKVKATSMPVAAFPVQPIPTTPATLGTWLAAVGVVAFGGAYAVWEWRNELKALLQKIVRVLARR